MFYNYYMFPFARGSKIKRVFSKANEYYFVSKLCFPQLLVTVTNINGVLEYHTYPSASDIFENGRPSVN